MLRWSGLFIASSLCAALAGCAHVAVDPTGARHITGFVVLTLPPADQPVGADVIRMRALGLAVTRGAAAGAQFAFGYSDTTIAAMKNDAAVSRTALHRATGQEQAEEE